MRANRLWWCLPTIVLSAADGLLTLWGQPEAYWSGDHANFDEYNPIGAWLLSLHPLALAAAGVPYLAIVVALVLWLPRRWAALVAVVLAFAHACAVIEWCRILFGQFASAVVLVALIVIALAVISWQRGRDRASEPIPADLPKD